MPPLVEESDNRYAQRNGVCRGERQVAVGIHICTQDSRDTVDEHTGDIGLRR